MEASAAIGLAPPHLDAEVGDGEKKVEVEGEGIMAEGYGVCAICLERILIQEAALVKGCEHAYCVTCILRWATYKQNPSCPQCKHPFNFLNVHRSLDGCIHDYMFEESVCLLLRATWFLPLSVEPNEDVSDELEDLDLYRYDYEGEDDDDDDLDEAFYFTNSSSSSIRIGNRRWGDNGYVRAGRKEARPANRQSFGGDSDAGPSRCLKKKEASSPKEATGRRAKRALKREAADKAAAAKHEKHLQRFGRN
ncbi:uncharacterized protein A4U43_C07F16480 [Asparagus officinalis]|uniref:RING-type domain-containing protein n=1 Tax=Asparagus officinalis TaxID=4686 RepID=A0A5P1ECF4_ASPOF|nr:uncharacterized protein LOC109848999 [Asparagus officinalis]ONK63556.1 uncharacterized protein A4U43_C07F16480 [Asparagus officinalis]